MASSGARRQQSLFVGQDGEAPARPLPAGLEGSADRIIQGDCREVLDGLPEGSVDLVFADPPYNLQLENELLRPNQTRVDGVDDDWDKFASMAEYDAFTEAWLRACRRVMNDTSTIWVIGSYHNIFRVGRLMLDLGFWILNDVHWFKTNPMPNFRGTRFTNATETMIWAKRSQDQKRYTFNYHAMKNLNDERQMQNVWEIPLCTGRERLKVDGKKAHATQKPEALLHRVISASSGPGDVVLDPFSGTGTTAAVAKRLGRHYIGIEQDPGYVALSEQRLAEVEVVGDTALLVTPSKRSLPRVAFGRVVELGLVAVGTELRSTRGGHVAVIAADGTLRAADGFVGSIHSVGAHVQGAEACNGWDYWTFVDTDGATPTIDLLRERARALLAAPAAPAAEGADGEG